MLGSDLAGISLTSRARARDGLAVPGRWIRGAIAWAVAAIISSAAAYEVVPVKDGGAIVGVVTYAGSPPARRRLNVRKDQDVCGKEQPDDELVVSPDGKVANAVVTIVGIARGKAVAEAPAILDQKVCRYAPHVLLVPAAQSIKVLNDDGILHNIHTYSRANAPVNLAQPGFKKEVAISFDEPEKVIVKCDAHEWMSGVIVVMDHPYYARTDEGGAFRLSDVPVGQYTVKVWHEKLGERTANVKVEPGKESRVDLALGG